MVGDRGSSFPVAGLAVVALFLSTTFLGQQYGYDLVRQAESDVGKRLQLSEPPIEARLWEDPFSAVIRHRQKLKELCPAVRAADATASADAAVAAYRDPRCQSGQAADAGTFKPELGEGATLIAAILPGATFTGVEETRRRARFALLAGLQAEGYVPDDSERMGLVRVPRREWFSGCVDNKAAGTTDPAKSQGQVSPGQMEIVYETLTRQPNGTSAPQSKRVAVLWIDDTAIGRRWLSTVAILLNDLAPDRARLRILGPSKSDDLVHALRDVMAVQTPEKANQETLARCNSHRAALAELRLISPLSTAPGGRLGTAVGLPTLAACSDAKPSKASRPQADCLDTAFKGVLGGVEDRPFFIRTIATDDLLIKHLAAELRGRGLDPCVQGSEKKRVALFAEWDSIYARTFVDALERELHCEGEKGSIDLVLYPYLRGLDGATSGVPAQASRNDTARAGDSKTPQIEWPEGPSQRDYVRRLVERAQKSNGANPRGEVYAIGVIGSDVHDKLILAQALRDIFPDRVMFTTDIDVRLLHPRMTRHTRNLIVASSLPLLLEDDSRTEIATFRDSYQTAIFLGARYAVSSGDTTPDCSDAKNAKRIECVIEKAVATPILFEIGREGMVELQASGVSNSEKDRRLVFALAVSVAFVVLAGLMLVGLPAPAMQSARLWWSRETGPVARFDLSSMVVSGLEVGALGFAAAVVIELASPGRMSWPDPLLVAVLSAVTFWLFLYPGTRWVQAMRPAAAAAVPASSRRWLPVWFVLQAVLFGTVVVFLWREWGAPQTLAGEMREPFSPLSGVSAWPSQLLRTLVIVLFAWFLDYAWCRIASAAGDIRDNYFPDEGPMPAAASGTRWWRRAYRAARDASIWLWQPKVALPDGGLDGAKLWREYQGRLRNGPRLGRLLFWMAIAILLIELVIELIDGATPEVPARGIADRLLFEITTPFSGLMVIILLVLVGDATILTWRFITMLKSGRTVYPRVTVKRFAAELGPDLRRQAAWPIAARISDRAGSDVVAVPATHRNSVLDDWIDVRLLADHTAAIGPLIVFPFILVGLTVVARSRLFDNWEIGGGVLILLVMYVLWSIAMAALLNFGAEIARRKAVERMQADLLWMKGAGSGYAALADRFPSLIDQVSRLRRGAFAPFFEQPLVQAILVPLGGAGGVQLLDLLLFARMQ